MILNCVNSASKFPMVFRKVANELSLLGVSESVLIFSDIRSVSAVPLSIVGVSVTSRISLSRTAFSATVFSLRSSVLAPLSSHFVNNFDKAVKYNDISFELVFNEVPSRLLTIDSNVGNSSRLHSANFFPWIW